ncbi:SDR family oxidoreductase [Sporocytophaga myxococcoides]|uniref:SDR family oxidoreductase n=1 Tax=Sporocytophaga myxococcoides TaxID=153721 RepID=UPI0004204CD9|nr:SDR family oxidoreductase [Sporocytophaga myxococcoides]
MSKILITGATGRLGKTVIEQLLKHTAANNIVAFARDENKATIIKEKGIDVRFGSYEDTASLEKALNGIDKILLVSSPSIENRFEHHKNVVDVAKKSGVKHIVFTGAVFKNPSVSKTKSLIEPLFQTDEYIKASGLIYTLLHNSLYADEIKIFVGEKVLETGIIFPAGNGKVPYALRREMSEAAANVLLQNNHENKIYELTGNDLYSYEDIANIFSSLSGKTISYTDLDTSVYSENLKILGIPENFVSIMTGFATDIKNHQYEIISSDFEKLLGRKPTDLKESLKEIYKF